LQKELREEIQKLGQEFSNLNPVANKIDLNSLLFGEKDVEGHYEFKRFRKFGLDQPEDTK
jgi:hypothetical protein